MAAYTVQQITLTGLAPSFATVTTATTGDTFTGDNGRTILVIANAATATASCVAVVQSTSACNQGGTHNITVTVAAGATRYAGPWAAERFGSTITVKYSSGTTDATAAAIRL
jgi:hypothetical protein